MTNWPGFVELVLRHQRFVLTTHIRPDCDALGSTMAMTHVLESLGKDVLICCAFAVPRNLRFIDPQKKIRQLGVDIEPEQLADREALMILDTSAWAQLGAMADAIRSFPGAKMVLDHHVSGDDLGAIEFKDVEAEATGRLVIDAADQLKVPVTPEIARAAFAAVATDTGWFRFSSTSSGTMRLIARLIDAGAKPDQIYKDLYENDSLARLKLIGRTLGRAETELDGRLIHTSIDLEDFRATGAEPSDSEDIINMTLGVSGTQAAVIFVEQQTGGFKISLRSRCAMDCAALAEQFGGGGHKKAAGLFINEPLDSARRKVLDAVRAALRGEGRGERGE
ncbi:MAG: DHH family phosphoesterase [Pirellulales bacterium]|nr:DHH family phosphoesterase [Pirellulales bacterium]